MSTRNRPAERRCAACALAAALGAPACGYTILPPPGDTEGESGDVDEGSDVSGGSDSAGSDSGGSASGEELFNLYCISCHGPEGVGTALAYELQHPVRGYATWVVRNGRPGVEFPNSVMAAYAPEVLSDAELESIWDYLDGFPQPTSAEGLYLDYCRNCHGVDALGGPTGVNISDKEPHDILENVRDGEEAPYGSRMLYMPAFGADVLSDDEIALIAEHIAGL